MPTITSDYLLRAETWLFVTTLAYFIMNGAQVFETAVIVPKWSSSPPESFQLLRGKHGIDLKKFWIVTHTFHEITFILAIIFSWELESIRNWMLVLFFIHFLVRVWTLVYFAPKIIGFQKIANSTNSPTDLLIATSRWRKLNYIRVGIFIAVSLGLIPLCMKIITRNVL